MRKIWILVRVQLRAMLTALSFGRGRKGTAGGAGALVLLTGLAALLFGMYSMAMGTALEEMGLLGLLIPIMSLALVLASLFITMFAASGIVFGGKDSDFLLALPVTSFSVMLSKMLALYLENFVFCAGGLIPTGIVYALLGGGSGLAYWVILIACSIVLPLLPTLAGAVVGFILAWGSGRFQHKALLSNLLSIGFLALILVGSFQINRIGAWLMLNADEVDRVFSTWLLPLGLLRSALDGSWSALLGLTALCVLPFGAVVWLFSTRYKQILSALSSRVVRSDYKISRVQRSGLFSALFQKELGRYVGTPIYLMNTAVGVLMLVMAAVASLFFSDTVRIVCAQMGGAEGVLPLVLGMLAFLLGMTNTTCVSISLEGRYLWIVKAAPVPAAAYFGAKILVQLLVCWPALAVSAVCFGVASGLPVLPLAVTTLAAAAFSLMSAVYGLWINLLLPRLDCPNDTLVVKQSASMMAGTFGSMLIAAVLGVGFWLIQKAAGFLPTCILLAVILLVAAAVLWKLLLTRGAQVLTRL